MPRYERLGESDLGDELGHRRFSHGEAADDPEPVDVGEGLVDESQLAQLLRLEDGVGDRAANVGGRGTQGERSGGVGGAAVGSTAVYINGG